MSPKNRVLSYVLASLLVLGGLAWAVDRGIRALRGDAFWEQAKRAAQVANARADAFLQDLGYDPAHFTSRVGPGEGEEMWTVKYWRTPPQDYRDAVTSHGDLEVYLNSRGEVKRVAKFEDGQEQLLYGKDERIHPGMTSDEVRKRIGEPDYAGPPVRSARHRGDTVWKYNKNSNRTMNLKVYFENGRVTTTTYSG